MYFSLVNFANRNKPNFDRHHLSMFLWKLSVPEFDTHRNVDKFSTTTFVTDTKHRLPTNAVIK